MITASIVIYNTFEKYLQKIVACIINRAVDTVYVIDNNSTDHLRNIFENRSEKIIYIHGQGNVGYGVAHNIALRDAIQKGAKYHFVLNADIEFTDGTLETLISFMNEQPGVGLVTPKVLYPDGKLQYCCKLLPVPIDLIFRRFFFASQKESKRNKRYELRNLDYSMVHFDIPVLSGCFLLVRVSILEQVGLFDERFFLYMEDVDFCRRVQTVTQSAFLPSATIIHYHERGSYKTFGLLKQHFLSAIKYFNKWGWFYDKNRVQINNKILKKLQ